MPFEYVPAVFAVLHVESLLHVLRKRQGVVCGILAADLPCCGFWNPELQRIEFLHEIGAEDRIVLEFYGSRFTFLFRRLLVEDPMGLIAESRAAETTPTPFAIEAVHRVGRVEGLGGRDEGHFVPVEEFDDLDEVHQGAEFGIKAKVDAPIKAGDVLEIFDETVKKKELK